MRRDQNPDGRQKTARFILIGASLMLVVQFVGSMSSLPWFKKEPVSTQQERQMQERMALRAMPSQGSAQEAQANAPQPQEYLGQTQMVEPAPGPIYESAPAGVMPLESTEEDGAVPPQTIPAPQVTPDSDDHSQFQEPAWKKYAVSAPAVPAGMARVVVIIDDLGMNHTQTQAVIDLPGPVTAAFLPYAPYVDTLAAAARDKGHELIIHMPMEPMDGKLDMGGIALSTGMEPAAFDRMLDEGLHAFSGYVGMNNHMGSRLTQDQGAMDRLMTVLHDNGLLFVDSRTIGGSVAEESAREHGVPHAGRDVFLDDDESYENVVRMLARTEAIAKHSGLAIAIGHPKANTVRALREWLPTLASKGLVLVPVSAVVSTADLPQMSVKARGLVLDAVDTIVHNEEGHDGTVRQSAIPY